MKINIKEIYIKNFLSVGNKWLTIDFREGLYRVTGENLDNNTRNGVGKSSIFCDALMFALFGKPVRKISLPDIPNTINNKKGCEVKLIFDVETKTYMIHRGIAPGFLILYENYVTGDEDKKNNKDEIQDSAKKLTQKRIDELIKANFNTFSHLLIMSNSYTSPFLDLDKTKKREIIEDILGVGIFGDMSEEAKKNALALKGEHSIAQKEYELSDTYYKNIEENYNKIKNKSEEFDKEKKNQLNDIKKKLIKLNTEIDLIKEKIQDETVFEEKIELLEQSSKEYNKNKNDCSVEIQLSVKSVKDKNEILDKLVGKSICPVCNSQTDSSHVQQHIQLLNEEVDKLKKTIVSKKTEKTELEDKLSEIENELDDTNIKLKNNRKNVQVLENLKNDKNNIREKVNEIKNRKNNFTELIDEDELNKKKQELVVLEQNLETLASERNYYDYIRKLLSNEGVKNYIIKKVLTFWNYKVNFYLNQLNADFSILFDEQLDAVIKSRHRDPLQYHSFSGGEKARIDVAILLSIIDISKLQNSIDLNVMVIDELLDGGLDDNGREDVLNLFNNMVINQHKSIYVISHNINLPIHLFKKEITLYKKDGFTYV